MSEANNGPNTPNRRSVPRVDMGYKLTIETEGYTFAAKTVNLGFGGALIETAGALPADKTFIVQIKNENDTCTSLARVVSRRKDGLAIAFVDASENFLNVLIEIVAPQLPADAWER